MVKTLRASMVVLLLTCSAYAGEMQNDLTGAPPPPPPPVVEETGEPEAADSFTETVLTVLQTVLALL